MTDHAKNYTRSRDFLGVLADLGADHLVTRPYRPQTNGKVERFNRTMLEEWAYAKLYRSNAARLHILPGMDRDIQSPATSHRARRAPADFASVNNVSGNHS